MLNNTLRNNQQITEEIKKEIKICIEMNENENTTTQNLCCCCCCWVTSVVSDSVWHHRRQPTRLPHPWDSPGKNTGVGCHLLLQCMKMKSESEVTQSCPTLSGPMDCSLPGSSVHGIFQARVLEWGAIAFSAQCPWPWPLSHTNASPMEQPLVSLSKLHSNFTCAARSSLGKLTSLHFFSLVNIDTSHFKNSLKLSWEKKDYLNTKQPANFIELEQGCNF